MKNPVNIRGKWIIYLFLLMWIGVIALCGTLDPPVLSQERTDAPPPPFHIALSSGEQLSLWFDGTDTYYAFLPAYADPAQTLLISNTNSPVLLDGIPIDEIDFRQLQADTPYTLQWTRHAEPSISQYFVYSRSAKVPALHIDVRSGSMKYIHYAKGFEEPGTIRMYAADGTQTYTGSLRSIKGRGNATWVQEKKPYTLHFTSAVDMLDMGAAETWLLLPNSLDPSHIRNKFIYDYAAKLDMPYTPQCEWVDLYLNGEYAGLYLLSEKNEVHPQRVDIPDQGFLVSREKTDRVLEQELAHISTNAGVYLRIHHSQNPDTLQAQFQALENALLSQDDIDPETGQHWLDLIDLDSWVEKYLIEEISGNLDAGAISQFFYSDGSGKIFAGPVWDYDISSGNHYVWQIDTPNMLYAARPHLWSLEERPSWYYQLSQKELFMQELKEVYQEQFRPILLQSLELIPQYESQIHQASVMNAIRWKTGAPSEEIATFQEYMLQRIAFLDSLWLEDAKYHTAELWVNYLITACYAVPDGGTISRPDGFFNAEDGTPTDWCSAQDGSTFDFSKPITEDIQVYLNDYLPEETGSDMRISFGFTDLIKYIPLAAMLLLLIPILLWDYLRQRHTSVKKADRAISTVGESLNERN